MFKPLARRELWGFWFAPNTGNIYTSETDTNIASEFTFENAWYVATGRFGQPTCPLAFFQYPTEQTAQKVFAWVKSLVQLGGTTLELIKEPLRSDPYGFETSHAWSIGVRKNDEEDYYERFSVGALANSIIRHGIGPLNYAAKSFIAELELAKKGV